jgi:hypothetical protein
MTDELKTEKQGLNFGVNEGYRMADNFKSLHWVYLF